MAKTHLAPEPLVGQGITVMAKSLFEESQQNGDNDTGL